MNSRQAKEVEEIVDAILDWRDADHIKRLNGAERDYYRSARGYDPKDGFFDSVQELLLVKGVTADLFYGIDGRPGLRDVVSVFCKLDKINMNSVTSPVLQALGVEAPDADEMVQDAWRRSHVLRGARGAEAHRDRSGPRQRARVGRAADGAGRGARRHGEARQSLDDRGGHEPRGLGRRGEADHAALDGSRAVAGQGAARGGGRRAAESPSRDPERAVAASRAERTSSTGSGSTSPSTRWRWRISASGSSRSRCGGRGRCRCRDRIAPTSAVSR